MAANAPRRGRGTARCPRPAPGGALRRPRGATAARQSGACRPLAAEGGGAMCGAGAADGAGREELINLLVCVSYTSKG